MAIDQARLHMYNTCIVTFLWGKVAAALTQVVVGVATRNPQKGNHPETMDSKVVGGIVGGGWVHL